MLSRARGWWLLPRRPVAASSCPPDRPARLRREVRRSRSIQPAARHVAGHHVAVAGRHGLGVRRVGVHEQHVLHGRLLPLPAVPSGDPARPCSRAGRSRAQRSSPAAHKALPCRAWRISPRFVATEVWAQCLGMMTFTDLASVPADPLAPFPDQLRLAVAAYLARSRAPPGSTPDLTCAVTCPGAPSAAWTRWPPGGRTWSCTSDGCRRSATSSPPPCRGGARSWQGSPR